MKFTRFIWAVSMVLLCHAMGFAIDREMTYSPQSTTFRVTTLNSAKAVTLKIYSEGQGGSPILQVKMKKGKIALGDFRVWTATVKGDLKGRFYTFNVKCGTRYLGENPGIFAKAVGVNGKRGAIIDMNTTNPQGWSGDKRPAIEGKDLVIYEMHHRDFSIARNINLNPAMPVKVKRASTEYPGKFLALTEPWAIDHLKDLGVNAVHLLPSFDYASVDETKLDTPQYNWGYDPLNYNVPEGSYSTNPHKPEVRIKEFKTMVQALHKAGIKVILDVVYNHTFDIEGSNFQLTCPDAFFRRTEQGQYSNGSGCGNETASESAVMRDFMLKSVKYWVDEYHIDGFRFDLMGVHDIETMNLLRQELPQDIFIYGEGWSAGSCALPVERLGVKANVPLMPGIAAFSDDMRDALRGPFSDDRKGAFLAGFAGEEESMKAGIAGCIEHPQVNYAQVNYSKKPWCVEPTQMIAYVSCHDDMCLVDRLKSSIPDLGIDELIRLDLLAQTAVFTSQGVPFMLSGEELLRDKKGVHNSYNSPDSVNQLNWNGAILYPQVYSYYKNLIHLRKNHPAFRLGSAGQVRRHLEFLPGQDCLVAFHLKDHAGGDSWKDIYVVLNGSKDVRTVDVPNARYTIVCTDGVINEEGLFTTTTSQLEVPAQSAMIVHN